MCFKIFRDKSPKVAAANEVLIKRLTALTKAKDVAIAGLHILQIAAKDLKLWYSTVSQTERLEYRNTENLSCENIFGFTPLVHHHASHLREEICIQPLVNASFTQLVFLYIPW